MWWLVACEEPAPAEPPLPFAFERRLIAGPDAEEDRFWGAGVLAFDADGDDDLDLLLPGPHVTRFFRLDGADYVEDPTALPTSDTPFAVGGAAADIDGDLDLDVVITRWGPGDLLWRNDGGVFTASPSGIELPSHSQSASFADADGDGDLDLAIAGHGEVEGGDKIVVPGPSDGNRLWLNDGAGNFVDAPDRVSDDVRDGYAYVIAWTDLNGDSAPDWFVANDYPLWKPTLGAAQTDGSFEVATGIGLVHDAAGMGLGAEDVNGDGLDDFLVPIWDRLLYLRSTARGLWTESALAAGFRVPKRSEQWIGWGAEWADLDSDGDLDGLVAFGHLDAVAPIGARGGSTDNAVDQRFAVYRSEGDGFTEQAAEFGLDDVGVWRGFVVADLDRNGRLDVVRRDLRGDTWIDLGSGGSAGWLRVIPEPPVNAPGAVVWVAVGGAVQRRVVRAGGTSLASSGPPEAHFGLGSAQRVDWVEVAWPDGTVQRVYEVPAGELRLSLR